MSYRILEDWLKTHRNASYPESDEIHPAQQKFAYMAPFFPLRDNGWYWAQDIRSLGYSYLEHSDQPGDEGGSLWRWLGPVLGVSGVAMLSGGIWAAKKYKGEMCPLHSVMNTVHSVVVFVSLYCLRSEKMFGPFSTLGYIFVRSGSQSSKSS